MSDRATSDAYLGIDITLPSGKVLHCEPLPLRRALYWLKLRGWSEFAPRNEDERRIRLMAQAELLETFPAEIAPEGEEEAFEGLLPGEVYALADRFLAFRRPDVVRGIDADAARVEPGGPKTTAGASTT